MRIDQTRIKSFWDNPDRYRLAYQCDIAPAAMPYALARGIALHNTLDYEARGIPAKDIKDILLGKQPDHTGRVLHLSPLAVANGWAMALAYLEQSPAYELLASEAEYEIPVPDSPHSAVGRLDRLIRDEHGDVWLLEFKSCRTGTRRYYKEREWITDIQADLEILGAQELGYNPKGVKVQYIEEAQPPRVWDELLVTRKPAQLARALWKVHQTCETIEFYKRAYGIYYPWPHLESGWSCKGDAHSCEFREFCQQSRELVPEEMEGFIRREEHLDILKEGKEVNV